MELLDIIFGIIIAVVVLLISKEFRLPSSFYKRQDTRRVQNYIDQREKMMVDDLDGADDDDDDK